MTGRRRDGEGSIFPRRDGYGAYKWVTRPDGTRARKYVYGKDLETVRARWVTMDTTSPEHDKLYPTSQFEIIYQFFEYLRVQGVTDLDWAELYGLILRWKGVDEDAYEAEGLKLKKQYAWLWKQFQTPGVDPPPEPTLRITRPATVTSPEPPKPQEPAADGLDFLLAKIREGRDT